MGSTLSSPVTHKRSTTGGDARLLYSVTEMQGWRIHMEDSHAAILSLDEGVENSNSFFGVYDGHSGRSVATFAGDNVHKRLLAEEAYREKRYEEGLKAAFLSTDQELLANTEYTSGCTAVAALVTGDGKIFVANAGDSRSVLSVKGEAKALSFDHKPSNQNEKARITEAGGFIERGRVNGCLALSRALGDARFKRDPALIPEKQIITADPEVTMHSITNEDEFLVIACDGIWDCLSSQQVINIIRLKVSEGKELSEIGAMICDLCMAPDTSVEHGMGCDNMTIIIVAILNGQTKEEWYNMVTDRVSDFYGYETPAGLPRIYSEKRLMGYKARREAMEKRERIKAEREVAMSGEPLSTDTPLTANEGGPMIVDMRKVDNCVVSAVTVDLRSVTCSTG